MNFFSLRSMKGFTLIELLVVIAIVAILSVVVILTLNPAQLLAQSRDSNRISDAATLKSSLSLYLSDVAPASINLGTSTFCYAHASSAISATGCAGTYAGAGARYTTNVTVTTAPGVGVTGGTTNWIPVNFSAISGGSPIPALPKDAVNNGTFFYTYAPDTTNSTYVLGMRMESTKYRQGGGSDVESTDGGASSTFFEVGTVPGLAR